MQRLCNAIANISLNALQPARTGATWRWTDWPGPLTLHRGDVTEGVAMDEGEWLASTDPQEMLGFLRNRGSNRKRRLFACACVRRIWKRLPDTRSRRAVEVAERYADGEANRADLTRARKEVQRTLEELLSGGFNSVPRFTAGAAFCATVISLSSQYLSATSQYAQVSTGYREGPAQSRLLRCVFGNPFCRIPFSPAWRTAAVLTLASAAYEARNMPTGTLHHLAALANALKDAGCTDADILGHLREKGPHVRGCWVVDRLLAKA
jgi:hypothetical protein